MDPNRTVPTARSEQTTQASRRSQPVPEPQRVETSSQSPEGVQRGTKRIGYGLPCAKCKAYYAADITVCPYCGCGERVAATSEPIPQPATELKHELENLRAEIAQALGQGIGEDAQDPRLEEQRERFLREYKAQLYASHTQIKPTPGTAAARCALEKNHRQDYEPAAICKSCYNEAAERLEQMEAAFCMDVREAAQLIYDAVWSDPSPSDPSRTYQNAAMAVLTELRRRAGIAMAFAATASYTH
jgi:tetrahydromethanopterin S-methyltransferase subunit G